MKHFLTLKWHVIYCPYNNSIYNTPVWVWFKVIDTSNLAYLRKKNLGKGGDLENDNSYYAHVAWMNIIDEHMHEFGKTETQQKEIELKKKLFNLYYDFINADSAKQRGRIQNEILFCQEDIKILNKDKPRNKLDYKREVSRIGRSLNRSVDTLKTSIYQYYLDKKSLEDA